MDLYRSFLTDMNGELDSVNKNLSIAISFFFLMSIIAISAPLIKAQSVGDITIKADGSVTGTDAINQSGNTYTLIANISGNMQVQKSSIVLDGAGYSLNQGRIDLTN